MDYNTTHEKGMNPSAFDAVPWIRGFVYGLLLLAVYFSTLSHLVLHDWMREDYSYGYLIPFVVLYLIWDNRERLAAIPSRSSWAGFLFLGIAPFACSGWVN